MSYEILLYYKYIDIPNPEELVDAHKEFGKKHNLKGRVIIAHEGINGTLEGTLEDSLAYQEWLKSNTLFSDIWFKKSPGTGEAFPRWSVKLRSEIVSLHLGEEDFSPTKLTGKRVDADTLHLWLEEGKDIEIIDMRNDYELEVGRFDKTNSINLDNFRDLKQKIKDLKDKKDKTIVSVCTGGVRCEKATGFLVKNGFDDVYQLDGGIVTYMEKYPKGHFKGKLYVFDNRVVMGVPGGEDQPIIGRCKKCHQPSENYINCANLGCHDHIIMCDECVKLSPTCSVDCELVVKNATS